MQVVFDDQLFDLKGERSGGNFGFFDQADLFWCRRRRGRSAGRSSPPPIALAPDEAEGGAHGAPRWLARRAAGAVVAQEAPTECGPPIGGRCTGGFIAPPAGGAECRRGVPSLGALVAAVPHERGLGADGHGVTPSRPVGRVGSASRDGMAARRSVVGCMELVVMGLSVMSGLLRWCWWR